MVWFFIFYLLYIKGFNFTIGIVLKVVGVEMITNIIKINNVKKINKIK